ncbi:MAG: hypothetical protein K8S14_10545, partial [Actinomycetia bacterium]|nr:hypothetical protein [Actinomycetes bacterium]
ELNKIISKLEILGMRQNYDNGIHYSLLTEEKEDKQEITFKDFKEPLQRLIDVYNKYHDGYYENPLGK